MLLALANSIDASLLDKLKVLAKKEKKLKEYKRRLRIKGRLIGKGFTKNKNIKLTVRKEDEDYSFIVIKTHKERYALAEKISAGKSVTIKSTW